jgi:cytidylate kinase
LQPRIAISGKSGCGATTATKLVSCALGIPAYNFTMRDLAQERRTTLDALQKMALSDSGAIDCELDRRQASFAVANPSGFVIGSRLAIWLDDSRVLSKINALQKPQIDHRFWLSTPLQERAKRIAQRESKPYGDALSQVERRDEENAQRYRRLYGINVDSPPFGTVEIDTTRNNAQQVADIIIGYAEKRNLRSLKF